MKFAFSLFFLVFMAVQSIYATPLIDAVLKRDILGVQALLEKGADRDAKDNNGFTALDYAISRKYSEIAQILYSDNLNKFIFLREEEEPIYVDFSRDGFKFKSSKLDKQIVVLGTITPVSFEELCQSYDRYIKNSLDLKKEKFHLFLVAVRLDYLSKLIKIDEACHGFTTFLYPNYKFYELLERLFKYQGVPQFLFRDKSGKVTGGSIESYIFEGDNGFTKLMRGAQSKLD